MKYYFFRDKDNEGNLLDGKTYHASGYVYQVHCELDKPNASGKDLATTHFNPFNAQVINAWRSLDEVELFEVEEWEYEEIVGFYNSIEEL